MTRIVVKPSEQIHLVCRRSGDGMMIEFAQTPEGQGWHVSSLPYPVPDKLLCLACGEQVHPVRGKKVSHHFRHRSRKSCAHATETTTHRIAKQIIEDAGRILSPPVFAKGLLGRKKLHDEKMLTLHHVVSEVRLDNIVPDIMAYVGTRPILIEVCVTHAVDDHKKKKIEDRNVAVLEIDLSAVARGASYAQIEQAVLTEAPRRWIHNPKSEEQARQMCEQDREHLKALAVEFARPVPITRTDVRVDINEARKALLRIGLDTYLGPHPALDGAFVGEPGDWRAFLLARILLLQTRYTPPVTKDAGDRDIDVKTALKVLNTSNLIKPTFARPIDREIEEATALGLSINSAWRSIERWFVALKSLGILGWPDWTGKTFPITVDGDRLLEAAQKLEEGLTSLISAHRYATNATPGFQRILDDDTVVEVSQQDWLQEAKILSCRQSGSYRIVRTLEAATKACHPPYKPPDPSALSDLGIVIASDALYSLREQHEEEERRKRGERVATLARDLLGDGAEAFLDQPRPGYRSRTLREQAVGDEYGFRNAQREIEQERAANDSERELLELATSAFGKEEAEMFVEESRGQSESRTAYVRKCATKGDTTAAKMIVETEQSRRMQIELDNQARLRAREDFRKEHLDLLRASFGVDSPERFELFLQTQHPDLGNMRPRELCGSVQGYEKCLALARKLKRRRII